MIEHLIKPGDKVRIKSKEEIKKNTPGGFIGSMYSYCGETAIVVAYDSLDCMWLKLKFDDPSLYRYGSWNWSVKMVDLIRRNNEISW